MNKTILVTGGAGYIGSTTTKILSQKKYQTIILDNLSTGHKELTQNHLFYKGDLSDKKFLHKIFNENKIDAVIHFAADSSVAESIKNPQKYYQNNVSNTLNLLSAMKEHHINKIVFSSTAALYGVPTQIPITEKTPTQPINPYGKSKLFIEMILEDFYKAYGLNSISLRYFNACGTEASFEVGEAHKPETHLIPLTVQAAINQQKTLHIYGTDYNTADGTCIRDYIHVADLAEAHIKSLEYLWDKRARLSLNLSNDRGFSILEIIKATEEVTGKKIEIKYERRRKGDPPKLIGSSQQARKILAWHPKHTKIKRIIESVWTWQQTSIYQKIMKKI